MRTLIRWFWRAQVVALIALVFASVAVLVTGLGRPAAADPRTGDRPTKSAERPTKELLDQLLKAYRVYELPEPPTDAPLVSFPSGSRVDETGEHRIYSLGFLLKPVKEGGPVRVFRGTGTIQELGRHEVARPVEPRPETLRDIEEGVDDVFAVQCHARGWTELALKVLKKHVNDPWPAAKRLAGTAWRYWVFKISEPGSDRAVIARQLMVLLRERPDEFDEANRGLVRSLELAMAPGKGKPGTVEALIDGLIDVTETDQTRDFVGRPLHPNYLKVGRLGFEAVPALIEHLDDERLTRARKEPLDNFRGYAYRVGDVACDLLQGLSGEDLGKDWLRRQQGYRLDKEVVRKWWAAAKGVGEEEYFLRHVLDEKRDKHWPNSVMIVVLAHKYPKQLPALYRRLLDERTEMYGTELAKAIAESSLPATTKRELFLRAAASKTWHHREDGIEHLKAIDPKEASKALIAAIKEVPTGDRDADQSQTRPAGWLADRVVEWNEPPAWAALEAVAPGWSIRLQHSVIDAMAGADKETTRARRLRFLSRFLHGIVWKHAARTAGEIIGLRKPMPYWTNQDWEELVEDIEGVVSRLDKG